MKRYVRAGKLSQNFDIYRLVNYFDVWGNPEDGFDVNDARVEAEDIRIKKDATDSEIIEALINYGWLSPDARGRIYVEDLGTGWIELSLEETGEPIGRLELKESVESSSRSIGRKITASYGGWGKFYGLPDVEFTVPNDTDDPTIFYNGKYYNYYDVEDTLWDWFKEDTGSSDENAFESWVSENSDYVYSVLEDLPPKSNPGRGVYRPESGTLRRSANSSKRIKKTTVTASAWKAPNGKKYGKQSSRFKSGYLFTKKDLKQMVEDGVAESLSGDITSMNYDVIGFSWNDAHGYKSGILIQDRDSGKLYVGNTNDATRAKY